MPVTLKALYKVPTHFAEETIRPYTDYHDDTSGSRFEGWFESF